jgi:diaminopimelate epimerase
MCGNGIRCFAKYLRDKAITAAEEIRVETLAGVIVPRLRGDLVEVDMGQPILEGRNIPVDADGPVKEFSLALREGNLSVTCVSMGNPHAVVFVDDAEGYFLERVGPEVERHPFFPRRVNVEFVQVLGPGEVRMRVWERGAGVTLACGTGACAAVVASHWTGRTGRDVKVVLDGGTLRIRWDEASGRVFMTGPATTVFEGEFYL